MCKECAPALSQDISYLSTKKLHLPALLADGRGALAASMWMPRILDDQTFCVIIASLGFSPVNCLFLLFACWAICSLF